MPPKTIIAELPAARPSARARENFPPPGGSGLQQATWWLWPHLLSLDAPLVAVVWQGWWARSVGAHLSWAQNAILGGGVWLIYLADRLADTSSNAPGSHETARHAFYWSYHPRIRWLAISIFLTLSWLAPRTLDAWQFVAGLGLLALAGGYFWLVHLRADDGWARILPKETLVAGMFAAGTLFFVLGRTGNPRPDLLFSGALFGGLCFFNCTLITKWERRSSDLHNPASLLNAFPRLTAQLRTGCLCLALLTGIYAILGPWQGCTLLPIVVSALLLALLDHHHNQFSADALRVLADVALLTPWLCQTLTSSL